MKTILYILAGAFPFFGFLFFIFFIIIFGEYILIIILLTGPFLMMYSFGKEMYERGSIDWLINKFK